MQEEYNDYDQNQIRNRWQNYIDSVKIVHPLLIKAFEIIESNNIHIKTAYDIGCGPGNESNFLVEQNINTIALDYNAECLNKIKSSLPNLINKSLFTFENSRIENINWKPVDLILCLKVLPFLHKEIYQNTLEEIKKNLNFKGIFIASVFGETDDWQDLELTNTKYIKQVFKDFEKLYFKETKGKVRTVSGEIKQAHIIDFVYQKI